MSDTLKKLAVAGLTFGGLEYIKYRINGGRPLLEKAKMVIRFLTDIRDEADGSIPVTLKANDYKIV